MRYFTYIGQDGYQIKSEKYKRSDYDWYGKLEGYYFNYYHRINGPAYIRYATSKKKEVDYLEYHLYNEQFFPWWLDETF